MYTSHFTKVKEFELFFAKNNTTILDFLKF